MVEQSRLYPVNLLLNDHYCEWRVMAVSRCWPAPQIWTINIVHGLQSAPHPPPQTILSTICLYCICLSVAQISLSMVFLFRLSSRRDLCSGGGGIHVVQLCHACWINLAVTETQAWVFGFCSPYTRWQLTSCLDVASQLAAYPASF